MKTSFIIPTLDRQEDLKNLLISIEKNSRKPDEIIIIEQGNTKKTKKLLDKYSDLNIILLEQKKKSSAHARNIGLKKAIGKYIFFSDDDVILDKKYIKNAIKYLQQNPQVQGMTGQDTLHVTPPNFIGKCIGYLFCISTLKESGKILRSGHNTNFSFSQNIHNVESLPGCSMVFRKKALQDIYFPKDFIRWSFGEDVWFSYKVYKTYGKGSLIYNPNIKYQHHFSQESRISNTSLLRMKIIYRYIFWKQEVYNHKFLNLLCYLWSLVGLLLLDIFYKKSLKNVFTMVKTYVYLWRNFRAIDAGKINFNDYIGHK